MQTRRQTQRGKIVIENHSDAGLDWSTSSNDKIISDIENKKSNLNKFFLEVEKLSIQVSKSETPLSDF